VWKIAPDALDLIGDVTQRDWKSFKSKGPPQQSPRRSSGVVLIWSRLHDTLSLVIARPGSAPIAQQPAQRRSRVEAGPEVARSLRDDQEALTALVVGPPDLQVTTASIDGRGEAMLG
jgi:hypothetical protein